MAKLVKKEKLSIIKNSFVKGDTLVTAMTRDEFAGMLALSAALSKINEENFVNNQGKLANTIMSNKIETKIPRVAIDVKTPLLDEKEAKGKAIYEEIEAKQAADEANQLIARCLPFFEWLDAEEVIVTKSASLIPKDIFMCKALEKSLLELTVPDVVELIGTLFLEKTFFAFEEREREE